MRGRKPQPTALKLVHGNPGRRPLNDQEPSFEPATPGEPDHLSAEARAEWKRLVPGLVACGILTKADAGVLAAYCQCYGRWQQAERLIAKMAAQDDPTHGLMIESAKGNAMANPLIGIANVAMRDMVRFAAELGITPSARSRVTVSEKIEDNPFAIFKEL